MEIEEVERERGFVANRKQETGKGRESGGMVTGVEGCSVLEW